MAPRVSPTEAIRAEIHAAFDGEGDLLSAIEQVARLSVRLTFQSVVEEIIVEELCRKRYERRGEDSPMGLRNGFQPPRTIKTTLGPVELRRPKLRHAHSALCDQLFGTTVSRTNALETLVISAWVRGRRRLRGPSGRRSAPGGQRTPHRRGGTLGSLVGAGTNTPPSPASSRAPRAPLQPPRPPGAPHPV